MEEKVGELQNEIDEKNALIAYIDNRVSEIEAHIAEYESEITTLKNECETMITNMGGVLP